MYVNRFAPSKPTYCLEKKCENSLLTFLPMDPLFRKSENLMKEEVIKAVKNDEVKAISLGSLSVIMNGKRS